MLLPVGETLVPLFDTELGPVPRPSKLALVYTAMLLLTLLVARGLYVLVPPAVQIVDEHGVVYIEQLVPEVGPWRPFQPHHRPGPLIEVVHVFWKYFKLPLTIVEGVQQIIMFAMFASFVYGMTRVILRR